MITLRGATKFCGLLVAMSSVQVCAQGGPDAYPVKSVACVTTLPISVA